MQRMNRKMSEDEKNREADEAQRPAAISVAAAASGRTSTEGEQDVAVAKAPNIRAWDESPMNFPARLMQLLQRDEPPEGIYWLPDGKRFAIHTEKIEAVLVANFQGAKWLSFTRTLNKWGFKKALGVDLPRKVVAYFNPNFQKDAPELVRNMINHSKPANRKRKANLEEQKAREELGSATSHDAALVRQRQELRQELTSDIALGLSAPARASLPTTTSGLTPAEAAALLAAGAPAPTADATNAALATRQRLAASLASTSSTSGADSAAASLASRLAATRTRELESSRLSAWPSLPTRTASDTLLAQQQQQQRQNQEQQLRLLQALSRTQGGLQRQQQQFQQAAAAAGLNLPLGRLHQPSSNLTAEYILQQQLAATTADSGHRSGGATAEQQHQLLLLQSQLSQQQLPRPGQSLLPTNSGIAGASAGYDPLALMRLEHQHRQQQRRALPPRDDPPEGSEAEAEEKDPEGKKAGG